MDDFEFCSPTQVLFGKGVEGQVGSYIKSAGYRNVLLHYGGGSIQKTGLYNKIVKQFIELEISFTELSGVEPNPKISKVREGCAICRNQKIDFILAVGGGSVIDSAKSISTGTNLGKDPWAFFEDGSLMPTNTIPVGVVLTLAAAGSELSNSCVITNEEGWLKRGRKGNFNRPAVAFLNPELTYTVSPFQTACGIVDIMMHTLERYFTNSANTILVDRMAQGLLKSVMEAGIVAFKNPNNYDARSTLMWAGTISHNGYMGVGRTEDWASHQIEHEITGIKDSVAHGQGLSIVFPAWSKYVYHHDPQRFAQLAEQLFDISSQGKTTNEVALLGIAAFERFFQSLNLPISLSEVGIDESRFDEMAEKCMFFGKRKIGNFVVLDKEDVVKIFQLAK